MSNGCNQNPIGACSEAEGSNTIASGFASHAEGFQTQTNEEAAHSEGFQTTANGYASHAEGYATQANGAASHAEGGQTIANGLYSHAEGGVSTASGMASHAEGVGNTASGRASHAEGTLTTASGIASHVEGERNTASGRASHAEGNLTIASGIASHAEGENTVATGLVSHAEGQGTMAQGESSHAEGDKTEASGRASHAEGNLTVASGIFAHAEGQRTVASGDLSHAEGNQTHALGQNSHAEGALNIASGFTSHAEGVNTLASGFFSHTEGQSTDANFLEGVHVMGQFGAANELPYSWYLANGTDASSPGFAAKILSNGDIKIDGTVTTPAADYAEMFETTDGNSIDFGYFVTLEKNKVRIANGQDDYILGITSAKPAFLADSGELRWKHKYLTTEWGEILYEDISIPSIFDAAGNVIVPQRIELRPKLNPKWDSSEEYIPRSKRPEWVAVGLIGKLLVWDDGTCKAGSYCKPNHEGIATASDQGYRILERTRQNQILVLITPGYRRSDINNAVQLEKLAKLKEQGYLTEEEFQMEKHNLLNS
ncbi:peptidase G2 autoproteolytic cleavage domain-containing protein [Peribacillus frigoritolerans]|uniref:peptidase G2 autoproteolytic cleavage domain-containing protein n=1 Tax=Peribacillus frigoritolerans TaxID=450367 RepID=UPI003CFC7D92